MRSYEVSMTEEEWDVVLDALLNRRTHFEKTATMTRKSGYGSGSTLMKAEKWLAKAEAVREIQSKIIDKAI